jgi:hypothetical protein
MQPSGCLTAWAGARRARFSRGQRDALLAAVVVTGGVVGLLALLQVAHWPPLQFRMGFRADGRAGSTLGNPVYAGSYFALVALVGLDRLARARGVASRSGWVVAVAVVIAVSDGDQSRRRSADPRLGTQQPPICVVSSCKTHGSERRR